MPQKRRISHGWTRIHTDEEAWSSLEIVPENLNSSPLLLDLRGKESVSAFVFIRG